MIEIRMSTKSQTKKSISTSDWNIFRPNVTHFFSFRLHLWILMLSIPFTFHIPIWIPPFLIGIPPTLRSSSEVWHGKLRATPYVVTSSNTVTSSRPSSSPIRTPAALKVMASWLFVILTLLGGLVLTLILSSMVAGLTVISLPSAGLLVFLFILCFYLYILYSLSLIILCLCLSPFSLLFFDLSFSEITDSAFWNHAIP